VKTFSFIPRNLNIKKLLMDWPNTHKVVTLFIHNYNLNKVQFMFMEKFTMNKFLFLTESDKENKRLKLNHYSFDIVNVYSQCNKHFSTL